MRGEAWWRGEGSPFWGRWTEGRKNERGREALEGIRAVEGGVEEKGMRVTVSFFLSFLKHPEQEKRRKKTGSMLEKMRKGGKSGEGRDRGKRENKMRVVGRENGGRGAGGGGAASKGGSRRRSGEEAKRKTFVNDKTKLSCSPFAG